MAKPKIFISYDYDNDRNYKNMFLAWDKNDEFDFTFYDVSVDVSVDSTDPAAISRVISARISNSTHFLCLVGRQTYRSDWVSWEIEKAKEYRKKLVAVKIDRENTSPSGLLGSGVHWAMAFTFQSIKDAIMGV